MIDNIGSRLLFGHQKDTRGGRTTGKSFGNILMYLLASGTSNGEVYNHYSK